MSTPGLDALTDVLTAFCNREGLQPLSADEMLAAGGLNSEQRQWLITYCELWEAEQRLECEARPTPGDWVVAPDDSGNIIIASAHTTLACVYNIADTDIPCRETRANARLMAAAKDLAAVLTSLMGDARVRASLTADQHARAAEALARLK